MKSTVAAVFRNKTDAQDAITELLASGFTRDLIKVQSAVDLDQFRNQASGAVIRPRTEDAWLGGLFRSLTGRDEPSIWEQAYSQAMNRGHVILTVEARSEEMADRAAEALNNHSPLEVEEFFALSDVEAYFAQRKAGASASTWSSESSAASESQRAQEMELRGKVHIFPADRVP